MHRSFLWLTLAIGAAVNVVPWLRFLADAPAAELADELVVSGVGVALLCSPYVLLAFAGQRARPTVRYGALALLLLATGVFYVAATSDAQGGLAAIYTLPFQWLVAGLSGVSRFRARENEAAAPPGDSGERPAET
ncbi:MAG: hypothetical protein M3N47_08925 [Chloroflexota bacterium]|nr:hypothetical protein [Chloroflexota bacterium]